jgi:glycosyltransferase involved in cell wall biosynthesis
VSTTLREGLSISILEAMASAKPIIATDIPENRELIENEISGITIPINSPAKIVEAIEKFCNNPDFAASCGGKAREKLLKEFTLNRMLDEIYQLYTSSPIRPE